MFNNNYYDYFLKNFKYPTVTICNAKDYNNLDIRIKYEEVLINIKFLNSERSDNIYELEKNKKWIPEIINYGHKIFIPNCEFCFMKNNLKSIHKFYDEENENNIGKKMSEVINKFTNEWVPDNDTDEKFKTITYILGLLKGGFSSGPDYLQRDSDELICCNFCFIFFDRVSDLDDLINIHKTKYSGCSYMVLYKKVENSTNMIKNISKKVLSSTYLLKYHKKKLFYFGICRVCYSVMSEIKNLPCGHKTYCRRCIFFCLPGKCDICSAVIISFSF